MKMNFCVNRIVLLTMISMITIIDIGSENNHPTPHSISDYSYINQVPQRLIFPGRDFLYFSNNHGLNWTKLDFKESISDSTYITAAAINPINPNHWVIGTSHIGFFESFDGGTTWLDMDPNERMDGIYQGAGFYNEISALVFSSNGAFLFIRTNFNNEVFLLNLSDDTLNPLTPTLSNVALGAREGTDTAQEIIDGGTTWSDSEYPHLFSGRDRVFFETLIVNGEIWPKDYPLPRGYPSASLLPPEVPMDRNWDLRREIASNKSGLYINAYQASSRLKELSEYVKAQGFNSVVISFKDDMGLLRYQSELDIAANVGSIRPLFSAREVIDVFHSAGIYVIARLVVFKDKTLYNYENNRYALWDNRLQKPWGVFRQVVHTSDEDNSVVENKIEQIEHWVDPYSKFVRDYNIQIAQELEELGVDEIQFDYIRFPSDGRTEDIVTRFLKDEHGGETHIDRNNQRVEILATFLAESRKIISIPIGIDVFGFNAWSRISYLGQDIEVMSHYVDVISPMSYPSHFPRSFYKELEYIDRAQFIYEEGTRRAQYITNNRAIIRQYVQAFLIGKELNFEEDTYFSYLDRQLDGVRLGGGCGFLLWNNSGNYYMINEETMKEHVQPTDHCR